MKAFSIVSPSRVIFGAGKTAEIPEVVRSLAKDGNILVLSDKGVSGTGIPAKTATGAIFIKE